MIKLEYNNYEYFLNKRVSEEMDKEILIAIPARYGSKRFPGKPLVKIAGKEMLMRVWEIAQKASKDFSRCKIVVATEDERILEFCKGQGIECVMTSEDCKSGTDRIMEVISTLRLSPNFIVNLQGDNPLCPPWFVRSLIEEYHRDDTIEVLTPSVRLSWEELSKLRESKEKTPYSGTTVIVNKEGYGIWFSKNIIPVIRKESELRAKESKSPILRHIGVYGYSMKALKAFSELPESYYEKLEGLEQLRFLENGIKIKVIEVDYKGYLSMGGIDSPEDVVRAEELFRKQGEFR